MLGILVAIFRSRPAARRSGTRSSTRRHVAGLHRQPEEGYYSVGAAIWLNIRMFLVAEVLILVAAPADRAHPPVDRPGTVSDPGARHDLRRLLSRVPLLLVVLALGLRRSGLYLPVISHQPDAVYGVAALVLSYSAYVSEVYRAGLNSVHQSQVAAARSLGLSQRTALRYVILPQAVRNIIPPLLNDFISLQKDTALVGLLGVIEANQAAEIYSDTVFNFSSFTVAAILFLILTIPLARFTDRLIERDRRAGSPGHAMYRDRTGRGGAAIRIEGPAQVVRRERGARGHQPVRRPARGDLPDRRVRLGQVHAAALRQPARADRRRADQRCAAS